MKKQPEITEKTKQRFAEVFCLLYSQMPVEKIFVQQLTKQAGYNRSTFYHYFCDIYELLAYVEDDVLAYLHGAIASQAVVVRGPQQLAALFEQKGNQLNALLGDYGSIHFIERLKAEFAAGYAASEAAADNPLEPYLMEFHLSTTLSLFRLWHRRNHDLSVEQLSELIDKLYSMGIS